MTSSALKLPRPARPSASRTALSVIPGGSGLKGAWFPIALLLTLVGGLLATLMLNTGLAEGSYQRDRLVNESTVLADRQEVLTHELDALRAPASLAQRALKQGMVPASSPAFIRLEDGTILGVAESATKETPFKVITAPGTSSKAATSDKATADSDAGTDAAASDAAKD